jgi:hypothetical protein
MLTVVFAAWFATAVGFGLVANRSVADAARG